jgi:hypothetical protein
VFGIVCLATLLGLFHAEENLRGRHAWNKYKRELKAKGQWLDYAAMIPPPVPDDQNFAMTPRLAALFDYLPGSSQTKDSNAWSNAKFPDGEILGYSTCQWSSNGVADFRQCLAGMYEARQGQTLRTSLSDSVKTNRVEAAALLLKEMTNYSSLFDEIEQAARRPYSRFNLDYEQDDKFAIRLPHLACLKQYCIVYATRASAELATGQTDRAFDDVNLTLYLTDTIKTEPALISYLVRCACYRIDLQPVWEGLAQHQWTDAQLRTFQEKLGQINLLNEHVAAMRHERCGCDAVFDYWATHPEQMFAVLEDTSFEQSGFKITWRPAHWIMRLLIPRGWLSGFERINYNRLFLEHFAPVDTDGGVIRPKNTAVRYDPLISQLKSSSDCLFNHTFAARLLLPALGNIGKKTARAQTDLNMAVIACALERYRLANGRFPEKLDALAPAFMSTIPHDVINGEPLKYRCADDGRFVLYSVGWNEIDDGGNPAIDRDTKLEKDWVWQYPK